jgi:hypothetical protein
MSRIHILALDLLRLMVVLVSGFFFQKALAIESLAALMLLKNNF